MKTQGIFEKQDVIGIFYLSSCLNMNIKIGGSTFKVRFVECLGEEFDFDFFYIDAINIELKKIGIALK